jgi:TPP-dependent pyruvate/acetoin dehydrogenase alpha subunit
MNSAALARINPEQMHAERIDSYNPLAVADAILRKKEIRLMATPVLLDTLTYRYGGHSPSDQGSYREKRSRSLAGASTVGCQQRSSQSLHQRRH